MKEIIRKEKEEGKFCLVVKLLDPRPQENALIRGVTTRSGKHTTEVDRNVPRFDEAGNVLDPNRMEHSLVKTPVGKNTQSGLTKKVSKVPIPKGESSSLVDDDSDDEDIRDFTEPTQDPTQPLPEVDVREGEPISVSNKPPKCSEIPP
jgi:hypothetical protein